MHAATLVDGDDFPENFLGFNLSETRSRNRSQDDGHEGGSENDLSDDDSCHFKYGAHDPVRCPLSESSEHAFDSEDDRESDYDGDCEDGSSDSVENEDKDDETRFDWESDESFTLPSHRSYASSSTQSLFSYHGLRSPSIIVDDEYQAPEPSLPIRLANTTLEAEDSATIFRDDDCDSDCSRCPHSPGRLDEWTEDEDQDDVDDMRCCGPECDPEGIGYTCAIEGLGVDREQFKQMKEKFGDDYRAFGRWIVEQM